MREITTVWSDLRDKEVRHTRLIDSHITLCGLGTEHTRNYVKGNKQADVRCHDCADQLNHLQVEAAHQRAMDEWTWPTKEETK